ncbi:MAG: DUF2147 domain-containing protein [Bacteroidales bacterium]
MDIKIKENRALKFASLMVIIVVFVFTTSSSAPTDKADRITGKWLLPDHLVIEIYKVSQKYYGKIIDVTRFNDGQVKDIHNPDRSKRNDRLVGKVIISGLEYNQKSGEWINGIIYAPQKGLTLDLTIVKINGKNLEAKGSKFFFSKTINWKRI